jgi:hypothetical protein
MGGRNVTSVEVISTSVTISRYVSEKNRDPREENTHRKRERALVDEER